MNTYIYEVPINFCPKCKNKNLKVAVGKIHEHEYSFKTGKMLRKDKHGDVRYWILVCRCGWQSPTYTEAGSSDEKEDEKLKELYLKMKAKGE